MEVTGAPSWVDKKYIENVLRAYDDSSKLISYTLEAPASKDGMTSLRVVASIEHQPSQSHETELLKVMIKIKPIVEENAIDKSLSMPLFETEMSTYSDVLPKIKLILEKAGITREFYPRPIYQSKEPQLNIVVQYVDSKKYKCDWDKLETMEEAKMVFSLLAQYHAASYYMFEEDNFDFSSYHHHIFDYPDVPEMFVTSVLEAFRSALDDWEDGEKYISRVDYLIENHMEIGSKCFRANEKGEGYNVLCHGDFHVANMLRSPEHIYLIDFQLAAWGSPAIDFYQAIIQLSEDFQHSYIDVFIKHYYEEFSRVLKAAKFAKTIPSLDDFQKEMKKNKDIGVIGLICFQPYAYINFSDVTLTSLDSFEFKKSLFANEQCKRFLKQELDAFIDANLF